MENLKNNCGASFVLFTIMMGAILLALLGAVFGSMYNAQNNSKQLRSGINAQLILQQLGVVTLQAYKDSQISGAVCPPGTDNRFSGFGGAPIFCFSTNLCVPHPISGEDLLCDGDGTNMLEAMPVLQGVSHYDIDLPLKSKFQYFVKSLINTPQKFIHFLATKSEYLSSHVEAGIVIPVDFTAGPAPTALDSSCGTGTRCKTCSTTPNSPTATNLPCMRFRACPKLSGCDPTNENDWIVQKVGLLVGPSAP